MVDQKYRTISVHKEKKLKPANLFNDLIVAGQLLACRQLHEDLRALAAVVAAAVHRHERDHGKMAAGQVLRVSIQQGER